MADSAPPKASSIAAPNLGKKSSAAMPLSTIFSSSAVVTPMDFAAIAIAGVSRSPSWPRSSSMLTLPLPAICESANSTPLVSSVVRFILAAAAATPLNTCCVCSVLMPMFLVALANWA